MYGYTFYMYILCMYVYTCVYTMNEIRQATIHEDIKLIRHADMGNRQNRIQGQK